MDQQPMIGKTTTQVADAADNAAVNSAYNHVHNLLPVANHLYFEAGAHPSGGSRLESAQQDADEYVAHSLAGILFQSAEDHLILAVEVLPYIPLPRYALYTTVRGAVEAAAWCQWLEALNCSKAQRIARGLTERIHSIRELNKLGRAGNYAVQVDQMRKVAQQHSIAEVTHKKDPDPIAFGEERPTMTRLLKEILPNPSPTEEMTLGEHTYKTLSARAHGTGWALIEGAVAVQKVNTHTTLAGISLDVPEFIRVLKIAVDMHITCVRQRLQLAGLNPEELEAQTVGIQPFEPT